MTAATGETGTTETTATGTEATAAGAGSQTAATQEGQTGTATSTETGAATAAASSAAAGTFAAWDGKVESLPEDVQRMIRDARKEAGDSRAAKNAADERTKAILKAAGIATEEDDPVKVLEQTKKERDDLAAENKLNKVERAAEKAGRKHGADVDELLDRQSFREQLKKLDPAAAGFEAELDALVKATVDANPKLRSAAGFPDLRQGNQGGAAAASNDPNAWLRQMAGR